MRPRSSARISAFGLAVDEHHEAEAVARLVLRVEPRELREHLRIGVAPLLGRRARRQAAALADRRVCGEDLDLLVVGQLVHQRRRARERIGLQREPLDEARPALEEAGELVGAQLPR